jgi:hypothetical protein
MQATEKNVFICYSSHDREFARRLAGDLRSNGVRVWIDEGEMRLGDSLIGRIEGGLQEVKHLGVILSRAAAQSEWVQKEVRIAVELEKDGQLYVLPLLYQDCDVPDFLLDRRKVDFRNPLNYQVGISTLVWELSFGVRASDEDRAFDRKVHELDFTRSWQKVVILGSYSQAFVALCEAALAPLKPNTASWNEHLAASFGEFVTTVLRARNIARGAWATLCMLVESERISDFFRYWTLDRIAVVALSGSVRADLWGIPRVIKAQPENRDATDLFSVCLERFFDPSRSNLQGSNRTGALRVMAFTWTCGGQHVRKSMLSRMAAYMDWETPGASVSLAILQEATEGGGRTVEDALNEVLHAWSAVGSGSVKSDRRKIELISQRLLGDFDESVIGELLDVFRRQPKRGASERYDFEIYMTLGRIFTPPFLNAIKHHGGEAALYNLLVTVLSDDAIDFEFSMMALMTLLQEYGIEGLLLDDRIPDGVLSVRGSGETQYCAADILCELISSSKRGEAWAAYAMIALHTSFDEPHKIHLRAVLQSHVHESKRLRGVADVLDGRISSEELEAELN